VGYGGRLAVAIAAGSLPVRLLGPGEIMYYFLALWLISRLPRLENRRSGFKPVR
jgi:hypothetical protein